MGNQSLMTYNGDEAIVVYQSEDNTLRLDVHMAQETVWLSQQQMAELFSSTIPNISIHIRNIFKEGELDKGATVKDFLIVQNEGGRQVTRHVAYYNLDVIVSVGYRVKSKREYPIVNTLRSQLNWSQYRSLIQIPNPNTPRYDSI